MVGHVFGWLPRPVCVLGNKAFPLEVQSWERHRLAICTDEPRRPAQRGELSVALPMGSTPLPAPRLSRLWHTQHCQGCQCDGSWGVLPMKTHSLPLRVGEAGACPDWSGGSCHSGEDGLSFPLGSLISSLTWSGERVGFVYFRKACVFSPVRKESCVSRTSPGASSPAGL